MKTIACFYHKNCADGLAAAAAVYNAFGDANVEYIPSNYGDRLPDWVDQGLPEEQRRRYHAIYIVDFSFPAQQLDALAKCTDKLVVLDHHKSAREDLENVDFAHNVEVIFDMDKSGAQLAWEYFEEEGNTWWNYGVALVQDRDLWRWEFADKSKNFHHAINIELLQDTEISDTIRINRMLELLSAPRYALERGVVYAPMWDMLVKDFAGRAIMNSVEVQLAEGQSDQTVYTCWCPPMFASDVGHAICEEHPEAIATCLSHNPEKGGIAISLRRATENSTLVTADALARKNGGGGHANAAGCFVEYDDVRLNNTVDKNPQLGEWTLLDNIL